MGNHPEANIIRDYLKKREFFSDKYCLTYADLLALSVLINPNSGLLFIQSIINLFPKHSIDIIYSLNRLKLIDEINFSMIYLANDQERRQIGHLLSINPLYPLCEIISEHCYNKQLFRIVLKLSISDSSSLKIDDAIRSLITYPLLNEQILEFILNNIQHISLFTKMIGNLDYINLMIIFNVIEARPKMAFFLNLLIDSNTLTQEIFDFLLEKDDGYLLINTSSIARFCSVNLLSLASLYKLSEAQWELDRITSYLEKNCILNATTLTSVLSINNKKIRKLAILVGYLEKNMSVIAEENFTGLCATNRCNNIQSICAKYRDIATNENIEKLLALSDMKFKKFIKFFEKIHVENNVDKRTFEKLINHFYEINETKPLEIPIDYLEIYQLDYSSKNLSLLSQKIIEYYYLKPFTNKTIFSQKNGLIEREVHGAMHACRVSLYIPVLHNLFKKILPNYVNNNLLVFSAEKSLSEKQLLALIRLAALSHDTARKDEGTDVWDKESGQNCKKILLTFGLDERLATIFGDAIAFKNCPGDFEQRLMTLGIQADHLIAYDYIRVLICLADCLDIMRCVSQFNFSYLSDCLTTLPDYKQDKHRDFFIVLAQQIHTLIYKQKDMLFNCKIIISADELVSTNYAGSNYSLSNKVRFEHSENVLSVVTNDMLQMSFFNNYLNDEFINDAQFAHCLPAYNPLLHGTSSLIFFTLEMTEHALMPVEKMLKEFNLAPLGGELASRGLTQAYTGEQLAFGRMDIYPKNFQHFNLKKILSHYADYSVVKIHDSVNILDDIKKEIAYGRNHHFSNSVILLIYLARAKQLGIENKILFELITPDILQQFEALEKEKTILKAILKKEYPNFSKSQQFFINNYFPVVFICEENQNVELINFQTYENRTKNPLTLGKDIRFIATDSNEHRLMIMKYLANNQINNVSVMLFVDLWLSRLSKSQPDTPFHHQDGLPKLTWLAAKSFFTHHGNIKTGSKNADKMIEYAEKYNQLTF